MQILIDKNLSHRIKKIFPASIHVSDLKMDKADDIEIWNMGKRESYCILTKDKDFLNYTAKYGPPPKIIFIKCGNVSTNEIINTLEIKIIDMGSGKSYLTFAMYDHFKNTLGNNVTVSGIELREELSELSNRIAAQCDFEKLSFITGTIENYNSENENYDFESRSKF